MAQGPDQFCGICGRQRAAGMSGCPNCGSPYERPESSSLSSSQNSIQFPTGEAAPKPTNILWGIAPPPMQYSGSFPPSQPPPVTPMPGNTSAPEKRFPWAKIAIAQGAAIILLLVVLITVLLVRQPQSAGNSGGPGTTSGATATSVPTATSTLVPTATATPQPKPGDLLCNVDVGTWTGGSADWRIIDGKLVTDGTGAGGGNGPTKVAPCQLGDIANYAVETKIQATSWTNDYPTFGITVRGTPSSNGWRGYAACVGPGFYCVNSGAGLSAVRGNNSAQASFNPGLTVHTYRVEVKDNVINFIIDGGLVVTLTDNEYPTGSQVGLWCGTMQIEVFSFQVFAL